MSEENHSKKFSLFKKKPIDGPSVKPVTIFDETCIDFELKGGPYQTSLIEASAIMKVGPNIGMPLPLKCT